MKKNPGRRGAGLVPVAAFVGTYFLARVILGLQGPETWIRIAAALLPVLPFSYMLWSIIRGVGALDELEQRIHLEALAVAFPLGLVLLMTLGLLELATELPAEDFSYRHVWAFFPLFYFIGVARARRKYS
jgi:hypothetical protein